MALLETRVPILIPNAGRCGYDGRADPHGKGVWVHLVKEALTELWPYVAVGRSVWMNRFMLFVSVSHPFPFSLAISTNF